MEVGHSPLLSSVCRCGFSALLKGTLNLWPYCCHPFCPAMLLRIGLRALSGAGSPPGAPMLLFLLLIRLAAAAMEAMRLSCRTGEHSHALQVPSRQPRGTQYAHTHTHQHTSWLPEKINTSTWQEIIPWTRTSWEHVYFYIMYNMLRVCSAASGLTSQGRQHRLISWNMFKYLSTFTIIVLTAIIL